METLQGWFSQTQSEFGSAIYTNPNGDMVVVTEVTSHGRSPVSAWPDLKSVGPVVKFVDSSIELVIDDIYPQYEQEGYDDDDGYDLPERDDWDDHDEWDEDLNRNP